MLLAYRYDLHDIDDVEQLCARSARRWLKKTGTHVSADDFDDLVSFLVVAVWRMSERYDPERSPSFRAIAIGLLGNRCVDWMRQHRGRTRWQFSGHEYEREIPRTVSLDDERDGDPLGAALASVDGDPQADLDPAFGGLLDDGDREADWDCALVRALATRLLRERVQRTRPAVIDSAP